jgi:hypothetical protein
MVVELTRALEDAVGRTLEGMLFMEALPAEEGFIDKNADLFWASLPVKRPMSGRMAIVVPRSLLLSIVDGFYGEAGTESAFLDGQELQVSDQIMLDTLAELLNTIAGRMMNLIVPANDIFELGLPEHGKGYPEVRKDTPCKEHVFDIDDQFFSVVLEGEEILKLCVLES